MDSARPEEVSDLIIQELDATNHRYPPEWKNDHLHVLFKYAVRRERDGDAKLFDAILRLNWLLDRWNWDHVTWSLSPSEVFIYASPRATVLAGPYILWGWKTSEDLISKWAEAISKASHTEEVVGSVVDALLRIGGIPDLRPFIPADLWLWLNERPSLPPACLGLRYGCRSGIVGAMRALNDIGVLTSYLILIWSEWAGALHHKTEVDEMRVSIREDFKGIEMGCYRAELIQRLDYILGELDRLSRHLDVRPEAEDLWYKHSGRYSKDMKDKYGELKRILQEVDQEATEMLNRMPHSFIFPSLLTLMNLHRIPLDIHVCPASPVSISSHLERSENPL